MVEEVLRELAIRPLTFTDYSSLGAHYGPDGLGWSVFALKKGESMASRCLEIIKKVSK